jgi:hypothetical protein
METKLSKLLAAMAADDWRKALSIASKFPQLGNEKETITRAHNALLRPEFYRQIGADPDGLVNEGKAALRRRYWKRGGA